MLFPNYYIISRQFRYIDATLTKNSNRKVKYTSIIYKVYDIKMYAFNLFLS